MRIVWSGVHERRKALEAILYALSALPETDNLDVLGEGRETARWKRLARRLGIGDRIKWHGRLWRPGNLSFVLTIAVFQMWWMILVASKCRWADRRKL